jgi:signal peptidase I
MLYVGRARRALAYLLAGLAGPYAAYTLARLGLWPAGLSWLVVIVAICIVASIDAYRLAARHAQRFRGPWYSTWAGLLGIAIAVFLVTLGVRMYVVDSFLIPSESMVPTLLARDQILVDKLAYRSVPIPLTSFDLRTAAQPRRGDLVTFRPVGDPATVHVKRIVGLPGDIVIYDPGSKRLRINGALVETEHLGPYANDPGQQLVREAIDGDEHRLVLRRDRRGLGGTYPVPERHYFLLGDNRDNSLDSRYAGIEYVPARSIGGRVALIWWNTAIPDRAGTVPR